MYAMIPVDIMQCAHSALRAVSKRGYRWPCPRPHMRGNYLNINHKKCKFLYDQESAPVACADDLLCFSKASWAEAKRREAIIGPLAALSVVPSQLAEEAAVRLP